MKNSSKITINLLDSLYFKTETIWQNSYWTFNETLLRCLTLNIPIEKLVAPSDAFVSKIYKYRHGQPIL